MRIRTGVLFAFPLLIGAAAFADEETFSFHESLKPGDAITGEVTIEDHEAVTTTEKGKISLDSSVTRHAWKLEETVLAVKDGSSTKMRVQIGEGSVDAARIPAEGDETVTPCPFIGRNVIVERHLDDAVTDDFSGKASPDDTETLHSILNPDQDFFPDKPVSIGETWDVSDKVRNHSYLEKGDTLKFDCRLDWVKSIDGRKTAQLTCAGEIVQHLSGRVQQVTEQRTTFLVDVAQSIVVQCDETAKVKYSTPGDEPVQVTGSSQTTFHSTAKKKVAVAGAPETKP